MALREILIELGIEIDKRTQSEAEGAVDRLESGLGKLKKVALAAGAVFLTGKLVQGFSSMINLAGDAAEIANKFGAVFVEETDNVAAAMEDMALRTGQSRVELQQMAADAGALVKPLVGTTKGSAELAKQMTETALDISSFENVLPTEALGALRSAIIGSSEPMLRYGVDTRQAALEQFALSKGINTAVKDMSTQQVTALRMELIMQRLGEKGAVGDATKTAGSYTNRMRALQGAFKDLQAEVGKEFLPLMTEALGVMIDFVRVVGPGLVEAAQGAARVLTLLGTVVRGLLVPFKRLDTALLFMSSVTLAGLLVAFKAVGAAGVIAAVKAAAAWIAAVAPILLMIVLLTAIGVAIALVIEDLIKMGEGAESVSGTMITGFQDLVDEVGSIPDAIAEMLATAFEFWAKFFQDALGLSDDFIENMTTTMRDAWKNTLQFWKDLFDKVLGGIVDVLKFGALISDDEPASPGAGGRRARTAARTVGVLQQAGQAGTAVPVTGGMATAPGARTMVNQPTVKTEVTVNATGSNADPETIGAVVRREVEAANEQSIRQTRDAFTVGLAEG